MKYFVDDNWVYFLKDDQLHKTELDSYGFFETDRCMPVDMGIDADEDGRQDQFFRLKSLLKPKDKLAQGGNHTGLFGV
jgi:hypothetical protein